MTLVIPILPMLQNML